MEKMERLSVAVVDPDPTSGTIAGKVYEKEVPVDNIYVRLYDAKGILRQRVRSEKGGNFTFEDLKNGTYRIAAKRKSTSYSGEKQVTLKDYRPQVKGKEVQGPVELILQAPPDKGGPKKARIAGVVREGDRPQGGVTVTLSDATSNKALFEGKTNSGGKYEFKDLGPGKYKVSATKTRGRGREDRGPQGLRGQVRRGHQAIQVARNEQVFSGEPPASACVRRARRRLAATLRGCFE